MHVIQRECITAAATLREQEHYILESIGKLTPFEEHQLDSSEPPTEPLSHRLCVAYGQQLGVLDDAIALVGPGTGLSPSLGLLDARGTALARALAARGLQPRTPGQRPLGTIAELEAWLNQGPLLMDGARWFGVGHWFVGIGYDAGGIYIRDSSGWDTRYLSWSQRLGRRCNG